MLAQTVIDPRILHPQLGRAMQPFSARPGNRTNKIEFMGTPMAFARNTEVYGESEPAEYIYKVVSGNVRTCRLFADGRRQIGAFYLPGDMFGFEIGERHMYSAEVITDAKVLVIKRSMVLDLAGYDNGVAQQLWRMTAVELKRAQDHILLLIKTAQERVADFLLEMAVRGGSNSEVELPMSRHDIADYLGLTIETISRTFTQLENTAAIEVLTSRHILLRSRRLLNRLSA